MNVSLLLTLVLVVGLVVAFLVLRGRDLGVRDLMIALFLAVPLDWLAFMLVQAIRTHREWGSLVYMLAFGLLAPFAVLATVAVAFIAVRLMYLALTGHDENEASGEHPNNNRSRRALRYFGAPMAFYVIFGGSLAYGAYVVAGWFGFHLPQPFADSLLRTILGALALAGFIASMTRIWKARRDEANARRAWAARQRRP